MHSGKIQSHSQQEALVHFTFSGSTGDRVLIIGEEGILNEEDDDMNDDHGNDDDSQDMVAEYWSSDHHKFDWSGYMQNLDPLSWHSLGLSVPESFLSKGNNNINNSGAHNLGDHTMKICFNLPFKYVNFMYSHHIIYPSSTGFI